nr:TetR/AcrR family transcriptional regulator [bacterium]
MRTVNEEARRANQTEIMEACFDCYAENGLFAVGVKAVADACGCNVASLYQYFDNLDDLIVRSTEHCMSRVEDEFMAKAPMDAEALVRFIDEIPYWTAEHHGKKYRLMYQVYTHPKYREYGRQFFEGVNRRYTEYARRLEGQLGIPWQKLTPLIFILIRACVHYALFEDEFYLKAQIGVLKEILALYMETYTPNTMA